MERSSLSADLRDPTSLVTSLSDVDLRDPTSSDESFRR